MSDLSAAERIAAEALAHMPGPPGLTAAPRCARTVVAALAAAGWLVTPVERENCTEPGCRLRDGHDDELPHSDGSGTWTEAAGRFRAATIRARRNNGEGR